jgi:paraquat-inducible protein B
MAEPPSVVPDDLPEAVPDRPRRTRLPLVWILPALVFIVSAFVVVQQKLAQGPQIDISFADAEGLEANKTKIRYKDVDIGDVTDIHVAKDRKKVIVTARIHRDARDYLVNDTRFWVVRPRITGGGVSGLGTLVSGSYISVDVGRSEIKREVFAGLEIPPIVTSDLPGREFVLHADDIGSLGIGATVFYRHISAGQVIAYALDPGGSSVTIKIFINEPYDAFVTSATRFWQASGIDMSLDSDGVKLRTESLSSILEGGIAFQSGPGMAPAAAAPRDAEFTLFTDHERAMRQSDTEVRTFLLYFGGSLRGLSVGAPVDLRGITIGEVKSLSVEYDRKTGTLSFPVEVDIFPQRIRGHSRRADHSVVPDDNSENASRELVDSLVAHGMRAEIKTGNLLTGQKYVAMDFHNEVPPDHVFWDAHPAVFPTTSGALDEIQDSLGSIAKKLDKVPFDKITARLLATLASLEDTLKSADSLVHQVDASLVPEVTATLEQARGAMQNARQVLAEDAPLQSDLNRTLLELSRAAKSVTSLVDYLERHPESLLRGKPGDSP